MKLKIGFAGIHKGEEPPLVGFGGSGTIFVTGCRLRCSFCQNYQISQEGLGKAVSIEEFASICLKLQNLGAININIVTGSHVVPALTDGFKEMRKIGVRLPVLWNSSGYDSNEALELLKDHIDIYLPDLKTLDNDVAAKFFSVPDYPEVAAAAILKMLDNVKGKPLLKEHEYSGPIYGRERVIVRHLILPGYIDSTRSVLKWFADNLNGRAMLSLMTQYTPIPNIKNCGQFRPQPSDRFLSLEEYETVVQWLKSFGIEDGFCQELVTGSDWLPDFTKANPFSSELSVPVWHYAGLPA